MGIIIIHTFLLMGDIIGTWCPDSPKGTVISGVIGAVWGLMVVAFMSSIANFFSILPVNFLPYIGNVADIVVATFAIFPSLAVAYQHGIKKGGITAVITLAVYVLIKNFGVFNIGEFKLSLNADGMSMLAGSIVMIMFAVRTKQEAIGADLTNIFTDNVNRIKKNWIYFLIMGGLLSVASSQCVLTTDVISGPLQMKGEFAQASLVAFIRAIGYIPLVYTTAIVTGVFSPAGAYFSVAAGMLCASFGFSTPVTCAAAFASGAAVITMETFFLGSIGNMLDKFPAQMSGGQQQRIAAARALILRPDIVLADEPTGALDSKATTKLLRMFGEINRGGQTILMVTHSTRAASHAGRVLFIKDGVVFHQLYRGNMTSDEMFAKIGDTLTMLTTGGADRG